MKDIKGNMHKSSNLDKDMQRTYNLMILYNVYRGLHTAL